MIRSIATRKGSKMEDITERDWQEFVERYPYAASFLQECKLKNELARLRAELQWEGLAACRAAWIEKRIAELTWWGER